MQQETVKQKATKQETKAVAVKATTALAEATEFEAGGWAEEVVDSSDIIIPKILLMHPTSELVKKGKMNQGDIIKSTSGELVAKRGTAFEVIVFEKWKEWRIMKKNPQSGRFEYVGMEPWTSKNDNLPWDYEANGEKFRRDKTLNFYCILADEVSTNPFPAKLSFTRTGYKIGAKIADSYARALMEKQEPIRQTYKISSELVEGNEETFFSFAVEYGKATTDEQKAAARRWKSIVTAAKKNNTIKDDSVDEEVSTDNTNLSTEF